MQQVRLGYVVSYRENSECEVKMSNVIVLSDSDEAATSDGREENKRSNFEIDGGDASDDFDFPEVPFCREIVSSRSEQVNFASLNVNNDNSDDSEDNREGVGRSSQRELLPTLKKDRAAAREEQRAKRQQARAREKALRAIERKKSRDAKPGECIRFMEVELDLGIDAFAYHAEIKSTLLSADVKFNVIAQLIPNSITWRRNIVEHYVGEDDNEVRARRSARAEKHAIVIWSDCQTAHHVAGGTFFAAVRHICASLPSYTVTLVVFGMEEYFAYRKKRKSDRNAGGGKGCNSRFETFPVISRQQLEMCLTEIQLSLNCNSRSIESARDLALMVYQYTKSISEMPYKSWKESQESKFDWYATGDNRNTVRVDKNGNGLKRLWQQQLCQFNLCGLEIAEAICAAYPSPAQLFKVSQLSAAILFFLHVFPRQKKVLL